MLSKTFTVPNICYGQCVLTIKSILGELDGVRKVEGNPETKTLTVAWDNSATWEWIKFALMVMKYPPASNTD